MELLLHLVITIFCHKRRSFTESNKGSSKCTMSFTELPVKNTLRKYFPITFNFFGGAGARVSSSVGGHFALVLKYTGKTGKGGEGKQREHHQR